jgi:hypothetical protein
MMDCDLSTAALEDEELAREIHHNMRLREVKLPRYNWMSPFLGYRR